MEIVNDKEEHQWIFVDSAQSPSAAAAESAVNEKARGVEQDLAYRIGWYIATKALGCGWSSK